MPARRSVRFLSALLLLLLLPALPAAAKAKAADYKVSVLVNGIVTSEPFLKRKAGEKRVAAN